MKASQSAQFKELGAGTKPIPRESKKRRTREVEALMNDELDKDNTDATEAIDWQLNDEAIAEKITAKEAKRKDAEASAVTVVRERKTPEARKKSSVVWTIFTSSDKNATSFECKLHKYMDKDHPQFVQQGKGASSNLLEHARKYHQHIVNALIKAQNERRDVQQEFQNLLDALPLPKKPNALEGFVSVFKRSSKGAAKDIALLIFLIANNISFNVVDNTHFKVWMAQLGHEFPSRATLMKYLTPLYEHILKLLEQRIQACGNFATTFDLWTSLAFVKYLVVTYHALDAAFCMISTTLDLVPLACSAYGEFIAFAIEARFKQHGLADKIHTASFSDSGSNCVAAKSLLTPMDGEPCFNHTMKLAIDDVCLGTPANPASHRVASLDFSAMHLLIAHIRGSAVLRAAFEATQDKLSMPKLELIMENITRWEGRFKALKRLLKVRAGLMQMSEKRYFDDYIAQSPQHFPTDFLQEMYWQRLLVYEPILECFHAISKKAQSAAVPTLSSVPHWVHRLQDVCKATELDGEVGRTFKAALLASVNRRMSSFITVTMGSDAKAVVIPNAVKAAILDPRYSKEIQTRFSDVEVKEICSSIITDTLSHFSDNVEIIGQMMEVACPSLLTTLSAAYDANMDGLAALSWWRTFQDMDRTTGAVHSNFCLSARMFLCMPAGGAPSEVVFSSTGDTVTKKRNRLGDDTLEQLTVVRQFVRSTDYDFIKLVDAIVSVTNESNGPK